MQGTKHLQSHTNEGMMFLYAQENFSITANFSSIPIINNIYFAV